MKKRKVYTLAYTIMGVSMKVYSYRLQSPRTVRLVAGTHAIVTHAMRGTIIEARHGSGAKKEGQNEGESPNDLRGD